MMKKGIISYCYNVGSVSVANKGKGGGIFGWNASLSSTSNSYYSNGDNGNSAGTTSNYGKKTADQIKSTCKSWTNFQADSQNINGGYWSSSILSVKLP